MNKLLLIAVSIFMASTTQAQYVFNWVEEYGDNSALDVPKNLELDHKGNRYLCGHVGQINEGVQGLFVIKTDSAGNEQWTYSPDYFWNGNSGTTFINAVDVGVDTLGNVYFTGYLQANMVFGTDTIFASEQAFLFKLDSMAQPLWYLPLADNTDGNEGVHFLETTPGGTCYVGTNFIGQTIMGNDTLTSNGNVDLIVAKVSSDGNYLWARSWGSGSNTADWGMKMNIDAEENIYMGHRSYYTGSNITKFDSSGTMLYDYYMGGLYNQNIQMYDYHADANGNSYVLAYLNTPSYTIAGTTINIQHAEGVVLLKFNTDTVLQYATVLADSSNLAGVKLYEMEVDDSLNLYIGGRLLWMGATINYQHIAAEGMLLVKVDASGNFLWGKSYAPGAINFSFVDDFEIDAYNNLCFSMGLEGFVEFDAISHSSAFMDVYSGCLMDTTTNIGVDVAAIHHNTFDVQVYPNPTQGQFTLQLELPQQQDVQLTVYNSMGALIAAETYQQSSGISKKQLDLSGQARGMYVIQLRTNKQQWKATIVKH